MDDFCSVNAGWRSCIFFMSFIEFLSVLLSLDTISKHGHILIGRGAVLTTALVSSMLMYCRFLFSWPLPLPLPLPLHSCWFNHFSLSFIIWLWTWWRCKEQVMHVTIWMLYDLFFLADKFTWIPRSREDCYSTLQWFHLVTWSSFWEVQRHFYPSSSWEKCCR